MVYLYTFCEKYVYHRRYRYPFETETRTLRTLRNTNARSSLDRLGY